jgi:hypothetical protein
MPGLVPGIQPSHPQTPSIAARWIPATGVGMAARGE